MQRHADHPLRGREAVGGHQPGADHQLGAHIDNPWLRTRKVSGDEYDAHYEAAEAEGESVHGEADFVMRFAPRSVLDAGCGTGRVGRELARRGVDVMGVDLDDEMLVTARRKSPDLVWITADLASVDLGRSFDAIVMAGNVMIFLTPGTESAVMRNLTGHLDAGGVLVAGFQLRPNGFTLKEYDRLASNAGLTLIERWSTWEQAPWTAGDVYAVSMHRRRLSGP
jgi:SAM-dependent methyltransferase